MGADTAVIYYGLRYEFDTDEDLDQLEDGTHPLIQAIQPADVELEYHWGPTDDEERYYLFIGVELGALGWEADQQATIAEEELRRIMESVKGALADAGLPPTPALQMQFEPK